MSLRDQAAADLRAILEAEGDFAVPITVTSPEGVSATLLGLVADIGQSLDPETAQAVAARRASVSLSTSALNEAGLAIPRAMPSETRKPWRLTWTGHDGLPRSFTIIESMPDELGIVVCLLEVYR